METKNKFSLLKNEVANITEKEITQINKENKSERSNKTENNIRSPIQQF